jgi:hypothetical protein
MFQPFGRHHAHGGENKKARGVFLGAAGSFLRSGNLGGKTDRITAAPGSRPISQSRGAARSTEVFMVTPYLDY